MSTGRVLEFKYSKKAVRAQYYGCSTERQELESSNRRKWALPPTHQPAGGLRDETQSAAPADCAWTA